MRVNRHRWRIYRPPSCRRCITPSPDDAKKLSRDFDGHYIIRQSDIRNLIEKIEQTLQQFNYQAASANITVFHYKGEKIILSSLEKLSQYDSSRGDPVSQLSVEVDFLLAVPQINTHQGYKVRVDINSYVLEESNYVASSGLGDGYGDDDYCIRSTIEYIDYVVARSFHSTVSEWIEGLEVTTSAYLSNALSKRNLWKAQELAAMVGGFATSFGVANVVSSFLSNLPVPVMVSIVASSALLGYGVFNIALDFGFERVGISRYFPYLIFNKGDERNYAKFVQRRQRAGRLGWLVLGSGVVVVLSNVLSRLILHKLGY